MLKKCLKNFIQKSVIINQDMYVQCDTLLPADVFETFRDKCIDMYGLDPSYFLSAPGLAWQACLK